MFFLTKSKFLGGIHLCEARRRFLEGSLHPANVLMCPHTCVTNLPKPREIHQGISVIFLMFFSTISVTKSVSLANLVLEVAISYMSP